MTIKNITPNAKIASLPEPMPNRVGQAYTGEILAPWTNDEGTQEFRYCVDNNGLVSICTTALVLPDGATVNEYDDVVRFGGGVRSLNYSYVLVGGSIYGTSRDFIGLLRAGTGNTLKFHSMLGQQASLSLTTEWYKTFTNNTGYPLYLWTAGTCFSTASREFSGRW